MAAGRWFHKRLAGPGVILLVLAAAFSAAVSRAGELPDNLLARARAAGVDMAALQDFLDQGDGARLSGEQMTPLVERMVRLAEAGLPYASVLDRARQGLVKGAPADRIEAVCARLEGRLKEGAGVVDRAFPTLEPRQGGEAAGPPLKGRLELIDHAAFALEQGVPEPSLATVIEGCKLGTLPPDRQLAEAGAPVVALTGLAAEGIPPDQAAPFVTEAFQKGVRDRDLEGLCFEMTRIIRAGGDRDQMMRWVRDQIQGGKPPGGIISVLRRGPGRGSDDREGRDLPPFLRRPPGRGGDPTGDDHPPIDPGRRGRPPGDRKDPPGGKH